jgi:hypothetical protein
MKEFMLLIRNDGDAKASLSPDSHHAFIKQCELYIDKLKKQEKLIAAQPLVREGFIISGNKNTWKQIPLHTGQSTQVGYYHIRAENMNDAMAIAKENPEFEFVSSASIEVRPIKIKEETTGFEYPK